MEDKDLIRLKERIEEIVEHEISPEQAKKIAVFVKLFVSMGANFADLRDLEGFLDWRNRQSLQPNLMSTTQMIKPLQGLGIIQDKDYSKHISDILTPDQMKTLKIALKAGKKKLK